MSISTSLASLHETASSYTATILASILLILTTIVIHRLYLSPLAQIPGPRLAAATGLYALYYDVFHRGGGQYAFKISALHDRYGPIVRITPSEIHIRDADFWPTLYASSGTRDKHAPAAKMAGTDLGVFGTVPHRTHRQRKSAISPFFSRKAVLGMEAIILAKLSLLRANLSTKKHTKESFDLRRLLLAFATDVIVAYVLGAAPHPDLLPDERWQAQWAASIGALADLTPVVKQAAWILPWVLRVPARVLGWASVDFERLKALHEGMSRVARDAERRYEKGEKEGRPTIFSAILGSSLPVQEKSVERLAHEGITMIAGGGETVSRVIANAVFFVLSDASVAKRLREELGEVDGGSLRALEQLPYLTAVIKEALRISSVIVSRLPLCCPDAPLEYRGYVLPANTPISMSLSDILLSESCFDNPREFDPERWLDPERAARCKRYYLPFSQGTRSCIGINLAYAEIYLVLACLFKDFELELDGVVRERDVDHARDCFIGKPHKESRGMCVRVVGAARGVEKGEIK